MFCIPESSCATGQTPIGGAGRGGFQGGCRASPGRRRSASRGHGGACAHLQRNGDSMSHSIVRLRARRPFVALAFALALATASAALGVLLALAHTQAMAQDYPVRPVRIVSVTSAGS